MLTEIQMKAIELMVEGGYSITQIAEICKVSRQTIYNWKKDAEFKQELDKAIAEVKRESELRLIGLARKAVDELGKLLNAESESVRLQAVKEILDRVKIGEVNKDNSQAEISKEGSEEAAERILKDIERTIFEVVKGGEAVH
ncbi:phBC6A51 family helix-turn-helix protein [Caldanaerobacter subterraneus]|nr:phBC6A51 family helix-turn-helix protein [Caldanaerobacter subterraneus]